MFRYEPPAEYDYRIVFTVPHVKDEIAQICYGGGHPLAYRLGGNGNSVAVFNLNHDLDINKNQSLKHKDAWLVDGHRYTSVVKVRKTWIAYLDGNLVTSLKTDYSDVEGWGFPRPNVVGLGAQNTAVRFDVAEIIEITGHGKLLKP